VAERKLHWATGVTMERTERRANVWIVILGFVLAGGAIFELLKLFF
jgi:hypothetical protein